jgi:pyruvate dehydrogenase E1 component
MELEWILMDALRRLELRHSSTYLRLTTKRVDQKLFPDISADHRREILRHQVLAGAYRLVDCRECAGYEPGRNVVHLFTCGAMVPEALAAVGPLQEKHIFVNVFNVTGPGPLFTQFQRSAISGGDSTGNLFDELVPPAERLSPIVTLVDAHPHALSWIGGALGARVWPLGVVKFGQSGSLSEVYRLHHIDTESVVATCLAATNATRTRRPLAL